ncbi:hypothetical protein G7L53_24395, partial [Shigella sonnei]|uniref:hypothetical protein n=1 Tax=Shigella sonnei TaxID=624 RepID=UPI0014942FCA
PSKSDIRQALSDASGESAADAAVERALGSTVTLTSDDAFFGGDTVRVPGRVLVGNSSTMTNQPAGYPGSVRSWLADVPNQNGG